MATTLPGWELPYLKSTARLGVGLLVILLLNERGNSHGLMLT